MFELRDPVGLRNLFGNSKTESISADGTPRILSRVIAVH